MSFKIKVYETFLLVLIFSFIGFIYLIPYVSAQRDNALFSLNEEPFGISYSEWTSKWWNWLVSTPSDKNPAADTTGEFCNMNQNDTNVWFITGVLSGEANRQCEVPQGKAIYFAHGYECSTAEFPLLKTYDELLNCAKTELEGLVNPTMFVATIDGVVLDNLTKYKVSSPLFELYLPENNIWGVEEGTTNAAAETYFIFLKPLSNGTHTFEVSTISSPAELSKTGPEHVYNVKYEFIVK